MSDVASWTSILQAILIIMIGWLARMVGLVLREVRTINGRIARLEEWKDTRKDRDLELDRRISRVEDRSIVNATRPPE